MMDIFMRVNSEETQKNWSASAIRGRRGGRDTSANLPLTAGGNGVGVLVRPALTPPPTDTRGSAAACVSGWSLADITPPTPPCK